MNFLDHSLVFVNTFEKNKGFSVPLSQKSICQLKQILKQ